MKPPVALLLSALALTQAASSRAATATLIPIKDNTLYESAGGNTSNGAGVSGVVGRTNQPNNSKRRVVMAFDVAGNVPAGATITSASLTLTVLMTSSGAQNIELHRLSTDWGEGTSDAGANPGNGNGATTGDATWFNTFFSTATWATNGGDYSATATDTQSVSAVGSYAWSSAQLVADAQTMLDAPAANFGWIFIGNESAQQTTKIVGTRENATVASRPTLNLTYTPASGVRDWGLY